MWNVSYSWLAQLGEDVKGEWEEGEAGGKRWREGEKQGLFLSIFWQGCSCSLVILQQLQLHETFAMCCGVLRCVAVRCGGLHCVTVRCSVCCCAASPCRKSFRCFFVMLQSYHRRFMCCLVKLHLMFLQCCRSCSSCIFCLSLFPRHRWMHFEGTSALTGIGALLAAFAVTFGVGGRCPDQKTGKDKWLMTKTSLEWTLVYVYVYMHVYVFTYTSLPKQLCGIGWQSPLCICNTPQYCITLHRLYHTATILVYAMAIFDKNLQHIATHCNTLQHTATHYDTLNESATILTFGVAISDIHLPQSATYCSTFQCTASRCNKLHYVATQLRHTVTILTHRVTISMSSYS